MPPFYASEIYVDLIRFIHLLSVAGGLGAALVADSYILLRLRRPLDLTFVRNLHRYHALVFLFLIPLWISGVLLIGIRTGFDMADFSPKLWFKIGAVSLLTLNGIVMGGYAFSAMARFKHLSLAEFPFPVLMRFGLLASISSSCWLLALSFGVSKFLAASDTTSLSAYSLIVVSLIALSVLGLLSGAAMASRRRRSFALQSLGQAKTGYLKMIQSPDHAVHGHPRKIGY